MVNKITYNFLGKTNIKVSNLCFGTLTVSPLQCNFSLVDSTNLFCYAIDKGINFFDTAHLYKTYEPLKEAIKYKKDIVISSKDYCYDKKTAQSSIDNALKQLGRDYIDIFLLHEQESKYTIKGHWEAIEHIIKRIEQGDVRAAGLSTHHIAGVIDSIGIKELQIIHPIYNYKGLGIIDGDEIQMKEAIKSAALNDKGIYLMKVLGGGHLISDSYFAIKDSMDINGVASIAIGMKNVHEIDYNVAIFNNELPDEDVIEKIDNTKRQLYIHDWCLGCGSCVKSCNHDAIKIIENKAKVDSDKCILCGYCADKCKDFCIKVI